MAVSSEQRALYINRLARCAQGGNQVAFGQLARQLAPLLGFEAQRIDVPGAEREDVVQEALLALHLAVLRYDGERPFAPLASTVVRRQLATMLRTSLRGKHRPLNDLRLEQTNEDGVELGAVIADRRPSPFEQVQQREQLRQITTAIQRLSELERRALAGRIDGRRYVELGSAKTVDNALQRARRRLHKACA
jgi:RNA polymerase sigma factor (sigma-70 family)